MLESDYSFAYQVSSIYSLTTKIIQPKFETTDILYLFFGFDEDRTKIAGPIFNKANIRGKLDAQFEDIEDKINNNENKSNLKIVDICIIAAKILYKALTNSNEELENKDIEELKIFFNEKYKNEIDEDKKEIIRAINYGLVISQYINVIIEEDKKNEKIKISFDDIKILKKK
jgi:hypothetical protein